MNLFWERIHNDLIKQSKHRRANPKIVIFAKKLHYVKDEVKHAVLHKYLEACKYKHALAFFQWRTRYTHNKLAQLVFDDRIQFLKD